MQYLKKFTGLLPPGYRIEKVGVTPEFVNVNGTATALGKISNIFTEPIDLEKNKNAKGRESIRCYTDNFSGVITFDIRTRQDGQSQHLA